MARTRDGGDNYADDAAEVVGEPSSFLGQIARETWKQSGADLEKFGTVTGDYQNAYLKSINPSGDQIYGNQLYELPKTTAIAKNVI